MPILGWHDDVAAILQAPVSGAQNLSVLSYGENRKTMTHTLLLASATLSFQGWHSDCNGAILGFSALDCWSILTTALTTAAHPGTEHRPGLDWGRRPIAPPAGLQAVRLE